MTQRRDLQALIDALRRQMQWRALSPCCFLVVMLDGFIFTAAVASSPRIFVLTGESFAAPANLPPLWRRLPAGLTAGTYYAGRWRIALTQSGSLSFAAALFGIEPAFRFLAGYRNTVLLRFLTGLGLGETCRIPSP